MFQWIIGNRPCLLGFRLKAADVEHRDFCDLMFSTFSNLYFLDFKSDQHHYHDHQNLQDLHSVQSSNYFPRPLQSLDHLICSPPPHESSSFHHDDHDSDHDQKFL